MITRLFAPCTRRGRTAIPPSIISKTPRQPFLPSRTNLLSFNSDPIIIRCGGAYQCAAVFLVFCNIVCPLFFRNSYNFLIVRLRLFWIYAHYKYHAEETELILKQRIGQPAFRKLLADDRDTGITVLHDLHHLQNRNKRLVVCIGMAPSKFIDVERPI